MAKCMVDVAPQSLWGMACAQEIRPEFGGCPIHGYETEPAILSRPEPDPKAIESGLTKIEGGR